MSSRNVRGPSSKKRKQPGGTRGGADVKTKGQRREKATTSPSIDKYLKAQAPLSHKEEEDIPAKEEGEEGTGGGKDVTQESITPSVEKEQLEHVDSLELKPRPKQIKNDDTRTQQHQVPASSIIPTKMSAQVVPKVPYKETKSTRDVGGKRKGGARGKRKTNATKASDGDFVPSSSVGRQSQQVQQSIRDHFPVRRSTRKPKAILESEKFEEIAVKLRGQDESGLTVVEVKGKGRGVVSTRRFVKGDLICEYSGELISYEEAKAREERYSKDESVGCYMYYFEHKGTKLCVDATKDNGRMGRLLNHSKTQANVVTKLYEVREHPYLCLVAAKDIKSGDELQYDYGERSKAAIESHPWLAA